MVKRTCKFCTVITLHIINACRHLVRDCLTGPDGVSYDPARAFWMAGVVIFFVLTFRIEIKTVDQLFQWVTAFGAVLVAGGVGIMIKATNEPKPVVKNEPKTE